MIYLDNNATTALDPGVLDAMLPYLQDQYGNPSSTHKHGMRASIAVEEARRTIADTLGTAPTDLFFTSGATESNNTVLKGVYTRTLRQGITSPHFIVSSIEHKCVLNAAAFLEELGASVTLLPVGADGRVAPDELAQAITPATVLVSVMWVNNEIGTINPIAQLAQVCHDHGVLFHTDAAQALGKIPVAIEELGVDFMTASAHKFYGPKGTGLLYVNRAHHDAMDPLLHGGGQEEGMRSGTLNVPGIIGMAAAVQRFCNRAYVEAEAARQRALTTKLYDGLLTLASNTQLNGPQLGERRVASNLNVSLPTINEKIFNKSIKGLMISSGSACSSADLKASYVLTSIGVPSQLALKSFRFGLGKDTTEQTIDQALEIIAAALQAAML